MANGDMTTIKKIASWFGIIIGAITIFSSGYYFVSDRFTVIAQVQTNTEKIIEIKEDMLNLRKEMKDETSERDQKIDDLIYNQKRLMEKQGIIWKPFDESKNN